MSLIITEGTQPNADGQGYPLTPGIYNAAHIAGWRLVTDAVHDAGGRIFIQLMHVGRISHPLNTPHGRQPVSPSAVRAGGTIFTSVGALPFPTPRALSSDEIAQTIRDHRLAAAAAIEAGADGVEIHAANGYLAHQFLSSNVNRRTDAYGGSVENRIRFAVEVANAVADEIGAHRTGVVISPGNAFNDIVENDVEDVYPALVRELSKLHLAFLNVVHTGNEPLVRSLRHDWPTAFLLNRSGAEIDTRIRDLDSGLADVITVGAHALANPDLVTRLKVGAPLNEADKSTFYGGGERGYTDYPTLDVVSQSA
jgi:N-ethylmaleimide reductase